MRVFLAILLVISAYVVIYYRLLVRHYYEKQHNVQESTFGVIFSLPPYNALPEKGKKYAQRYWVAMVVMVGAVLLLAGSSDFTMWRQPGSGTTG